MVAIPQAHPVLKERTIHCHTASCASTPIAAVMRLPFRGKAVKVGGVVEAAFTTDMSVAVAINGTAVTGSPFTITASGSAIGTMGTLVPSGANTFNEDDYMTFTPSGSTGSNVPCTFFADVQTA
jgi:hypothetical protein